MIKSKFAIALKELEVNKSTIGSEPEPLLKSRQISPILEYLEIEARTIDISTVPMPFVASYIHQLICHLDQSPHMKSTLIKICGRLEVASKESILQRYHLDQVIAKCIEQAEMLRGNEKDEVRVSAFFVVSVMLRIRRSLPKSITRALIRTYQAKSDPIVLSYLTELAVVSASAEVVPELGVTLVDAALDKNCQIWDSVVKALCYGLEHRAAFIHNSFVLNRFFGRIEGAKSDDMDTVCDAVVSVLQTWAGVFMFGLKMNGFRNLILYLQHNEACVLKILRRLLNLEVRNGSILESYTGFVFMILKRYGMLQKLVELSKKSEEAELFLNSLVPFCSRYDIPEYVPLIRREAKDSSAQGLNFDLLLTKMPRKVSTMQGYKLPLDDAQWDWKEIYQLITVVLPSSRKECESDDAKEFYKRLFAFFCEDRFLNEAAYGEYPVCECLCSLVNLLLTPWPGSISAWGVDVISGSARLWDAFKTTIERLNTGDLSRANEAGHWAFYQCLTKIMSTNDGLQLIAKHKMNELIEKIGIGCENREVIKRMLSHLEFSPQPFWATRVCHKFIAERDLELTKLTISVLSQKRLSGTNSETNVFSFIVQSAKSVAEKKDLPKLYLILGAMTEFLRLSPQCQELVIDQGLKKILCEHGHSVFCEILQCPKALDFVDIAEEINWWMTCGNMEYVDTWDTAVAASFNAKWIMSHDSKPSIIMANGVALVPAHLFGQIGKIDQTSPKLAECREQLVKCIPQLLHQLESENVKERRAAAFALAHFASAPGAEDVVCQYDLARVITKSLTSGNSYTLCGTLIACLSLFSMSRSFAKVLDDMKWEELVYGPFSCVVPSDPMSLLPPPENEALDLGPPVQVETSEEAIKDFINLVNPNIADTAEQTIKGAVKDKSQQLLNSEMALAASEVIGDSDYSTTKNDHRRFLYETFQDTPLMDPSDEPVDSECEATVRAVICELVDWRGPGSKVTFSQFPIQKYELGHLPRNNRGVEEVPEVYISDSALKEVTGKTREEFYALSSQEIRELRDHILEQSYSSGKS